MTVPEECGHLAGSLSLSLKGNKMCMGRDWAGERDGPGGGSSKSRQSEGRWEGLGGGAGEFTCLELYVCTGKW